MVWDKVFISDHPHVRGDNSQGIEVEWLSNGPSPRAWGQHHVGRLHAQIIRTIPTCVGTTEYLRNLTGSTSDHPHVRGDNYQSIFSKKSLNGPSPRAWGQQNPNLLKNAVLRTIPTCVGTTIIARKSHYCKPDHPHVRGDNHFLLNRYKISVGPSPRAWGQHAILHCLVIKPRTIPTCVGTTCIKSGAQTGKSDHPHVRGDNGKGLAKG